MGRDVCAGLLTKDPAKRLSIESVLTLVFKKTAQKLSNDGWKQSRTKFKKHVLKRKLAMKAMSENRVSPNQSLSFRHRGMQSQDDNRFNNDQRMKTIGKRQKAMGGRRGSKTAEQMEINLPMPSRLSLVDNFRSDDDIRKEKKREQRERQKQRMEEQQYVVDM